MSRLSLTQEYFLAAVNEKGRFSAWTDTEGKVCLVAASIMELIDKGYAKVCGKHRLELQRPLDDCSTYLKTLYEIVEGSKKPIPVKSATAKKMQGKNFRSFWNDIGESLVVLNNAEKIESRRLFGGIKVTYIPRAEATKHIVENVRSCILSDSAITPDVLSLAILMDKAKVLDRHFGKAESAKFKSRLKEIRAEVKTNPKYAPVRQTLEYIDELFVIVIMPAIVAATVTTTVSC